ncbi:MAG: PPC domain-containing protein, partial [Planctomycetales bacterium]|nr:PPC domain-containing protein [Planctomycetales bacterium]
IARDNAGPFITINANSLTHEVIGDYGRSTGTVDRVAGFDANHGPLVRLNRLDNNGVNGMVVRGEVLTTESIWDDTDIVHVLTNNYDNGAFGGRFDEVVIPNFHAFGGLRLQSSPVESLVVKLDGAGPEGNAYNTNPTNGAGFTATGRYGEIQDRIGGMLHIVGQPGFPVVLTSLQDDSVGAGVRPDDTPQVDTNNNGNQRPSSNDWRSIRLDQYSHDRNVEIILEQESAEATAPGSNATAVTAQFLGELSGDEQSGDDNLRRGFEIHGLLNESNDVDTYSFIGEAGTEVWIDVDRTTYTLDTVIELLDASGNVLARSDSSLDETLDPSLIYTANSFPADQANSMQKSPAPYAPENASGLPKDFGSINSRDAGMRILLDGNAGTRTTYHVRVRSKDALTSGPYEMQIRTREADEFPGSTVRFADIRYAMTGIEVIGLPAHSPLLGEAAEDEVTDGFLANNDSFFPNAITPGQRPQILGNLFDTDRAVLSVAGELSSRGDIDFYEVSLDYVNLDAQSPVSHGSMVFDVDYADSLVRPNSSVYVFDSSGQLLLVGRDSNIAEDRPGPLNGSDLADLSRGSVGPGDPFIGPVAMPAGENYYVAVVSNDRIPAVLNNDNVRLEPLNTVRRIAEDHIDKPGFSTAEPPVVEELFDPTFVGAGTNRWHVTSNRASNPGHGLDPVFDGSRPGGGSGSTQVDLEPNDTLATAQNIDTGPWTLAFSPDIGDFVSNTSTLIPHTTVQGTGNGTFDIFSFTVTTPGSFGIFDIDYGDTGPADPSSVDTTLRIYDSAGNSIRSSSLSSTSSGQGGSTSVNDAYIQHTFTTPGTYYVEVGQWPFDPLAAGATYTLNV